MLLLLSIDISTHRRGRFAVRSTEDDALMPSLPENSPVDDVSSLDPPASPHRLFPQLNGGEESLPPEDFGNQESEDGDPDFSRPDLPTRFDNLKKKYRGFPYPPSAIVSMKHRPKEGGKKKEKKKGDDWLSDDDEDIIIMDEESPNYYYTRAKHDLETNEGIFDLDEVSYVDFDDEAISNIDVGFDYEDLEREFKSKKWILQMGTTVPGTCVGYRRGGALLDVKDKFLGFLPLEEATLDVPETGNIRDYVQLNETIPVRVISRQGNEYFVSKRILELDVVFKKLEELLASETVLETEIKAYNRGGFACSVLGVPSFLPRSHLVSTKSDEELIGEKFNVRILALDREDRKAIVSHRLAIAKESMAKYSYGVLVEGVITAIVSFGAFVELNDGMSGLLHISQITAEQVESLESVLNEGMKVKCMVLSVDKELGRLALSTKALEPSPGDFLKDPQMVFDMAEETLPKFLEKEESDRIAREQATESILASLRHSLDGFLGNPEVEEMYDGGEDTDDVDEEMDDGVVDTDDVDEDTDDVEEDMPHDLESYLAGGSSKDTE